MGNNLKSLRKASKMTHEEAANAMNVSKSQFIKLERGERRLTLDYISRAAVAFNVAVSEVIEDADEKPPEAEETASKTTKRPNLSVKLADLLAKITRMSPNQQAQIIEMVEERMKAMKSPERQSQSSTHG